MNTTRIADKRLPRREAVSRFLMVVLHQTGYRVKKDMYRALSLCKELAIEGFVPAKDVLNKVLEHGDTTSWAFRESLDWLWLSATAGCAESQLRIACMYYQGSLGYRDLAGAISFLERAQAQGERKAAWLLTYIYVSAPPPSANRERAHQILSELARTGESEAQCRLAELEPFVMQERCDWDHVLFCYSAAARSGHERARSNLSRLEFAERN